MITAIFISDCSKGKIPLNVNIPAPTNTPEVPNTVTPPEVPAGTALPVNI